MGTLITSLSFLDEEQVTFLLGKACEIAADAVDSLTRYPDPRFDAMTFAALSEVAANDLRKAHAAREERILETRERAEHEFTTAMAVGLLQEVNPDYKVLIPDNQGGVGYVSSVEVLLAQPGNFPFDEATFDRVELS